MPARRGLLAWCLLVGASCATPAPPPVAARPQTRVLDPALRVGARQVWLRGGVVLKSPGGPPEADVWNPLVVELLRDGRVHALDPLGEPVVGYAPEAKGTAAVEERGLGLYVQSPTPVLLTPAGPEIGRVAPGTYLAVLAMDGGVVEVALRGVERPPGAGPLQGYVAASALGTKELGLRPRARGSRFVRDHRRGLLAEPGKPASLFALTQCGRLELLEAGKDAQGAEIQRVAQELQGVEIRGWVDRPISSPRGDDRCPVRVLEKQEVVGLDGEATLPEGYVRFADAATLEKAYEALTKKERTVHIPLLDGDAVRCEPFKLKPKGAELVRAAAEKGQKPTTWRVRVAAGRVTLSGPCRTARSCTARYLLAGVTPDRIALVPDRDGLAARGDRLLAYHQDDSEPWFLSRGACEARGGVDRASTILPVEPQPAAGR